MLDELKRRVPSDLMLRNVVETINGPDECKDSLGEPTLPKAIIAIGLLASQQALDDAVVRLEARGRPRLAALFVARLGATPTYATLFSLANMKFRSVIRDWSTMGSKDIQGAAKIILNGI